MSKYSERHEITVVGIDLGKTWLKVCGQDALDRERLSKKCRPQQLKELLATLPRALVGLNIHHILFCLKFFKLRGQSKKFEEFLL